MSFADTSLLYTSISSLRLLHWTADFSVDMSSLSRSV